MRQSLFQRIVDMKSMSHSINIIECMVYKLFATLPISDCICQHTEQQPMKTETDTIEPVNREQKRQNRRN